MSVSAQTYFWVYYLRNILRIYTLRETRFCAVFMQNIICEITKFSFDLQTVNVWLADIISEKKKNYFILFYYVQTGKIIIIKRFKPIRLNRFLVRILYIILDIYYDRIWENNSRTYLLVHICRLYTYACCPPTPLS